MAKTDSEKAETLGKYFSSVYIKERSWTWVLDEESKPETRGEVNIELTMDMVLKILMMLDANKFPGSDKIHPRVVRELGNVLAYPLYRIFDLSLRLGKIPNAWRIATVTAIYKQKGNKNEANNYRPISLRPACMVKEPLRFCPCSRLI